jgi:uncharacterized protein VirK/YbjX
MIEVFQIFCRLLGCERIYAVSESHRQHNHPFYQLGNKQIKPSINYNEVWSDRSGVRFNDAFFELPLIPVKKPLKNIIAKKRSMYRNRYSLLQRLATEMEQGLVELRPQCLDQTTTQEPEAPCHAEQTKQMIPQDPNSLDCQLH